MNKNKVVQVYVEYYVYTDERHTKTTFSMPLSATLDNYTMNDYIRENFESNKRIRINHYHIRENDSEDLFNKRHHFVSVKTYTIPIKSNFYQEKFDNDLAKTYNKLISEISELNNVDINQVSSGKNFVISLDLKNDNPLVWSKIYSIIGEYIDTDIIQIY